MAASDDLDSDAATADSDAEHGRVPDGRPRSTVSVVVLVMITLILNNGSNTKSKTKIDARYVQRLIERLYETNDNKHVCLLKRNKQSLLNDFLGIESSRQQLPSSAIRFVHSRPENVLAPRRLRYHACMIPYASDTLYLAMSDPSGQLVLRSITDPLTGTLDHIAHVSRVITIITICMIMIITKS